MMAFMAGISCHGSLSKPGATLVFHNGEIWTGRPGMVLQEALAVRGERILAVGSDEQVRSYISDETEVVDLQGRFLMPGFIDNHVHFLAGGLQLLSLDLRSASSPEEFVERIRRRAGELLRGQWITGGDWDHEAWPSAPLPRREWIDPVTPQVPVFVTRLDGHMALANSLALQMAGVDRNTPDPPGGHIVRDPSGEPTGILKDAAMDLVTRLIPEPTPEEMRRAARAALQESRRLGVTTVNTMTRAGEVGVFHRLWLEGELTTRIYAILPLAELEKLSGLGIGKNFGNDFLKIGTLKAFMDGSLGSTTAWFHEPYQDAPQTSGLPSAEFLSGRLESRIREADQADLQVAVHAIGDRANRELLDLFAKIVRENGPKDRRFRVEHAQHLDPEVIPRFRELGVIASMQPYHCIDDGRWAEKRIGPERIRTTYPFRSLLDSGALVTFGSDWNVAPLDPLLGVYAAVTRRTLDGKHPGGWVPEQKITVEEALLCYTRNNAYAMFAEDRLGTLEPEKLADLVVLSANPLKAEGEQLRRIRVLQTVVAGRTVYRREPGEPEAS